LNFSDGLIGSPPYKLQPRACRSEMICYLCHVVESLLPLQIVKHSLFIIGFKKCRPKVPLYVECRCIFSITPLSCSYARTRSPTTHAHQTPHRQNPSSRTVGLKLCSFTVEASENELRYWSSGDEALIGHRSTKGKRYTTPPPRCRLGATLTEISRRWQVPIYITSYAPMCTD
jgi:hypothetical protein